MEPWDLAPRIQVPTHHVSAYIPQRKRAMIPWLRLSNILLFLASCALLATGLALALRIEPENDGLTLLGLSGETWGEVHAVLGFIVASLVVVHLALNWPWIKSLVTRLGWRVFVCFGLGLGLVALVLVAPLSGNSQHGERGRSSADDR